jgi:hypothetical protein
MAHSREGIICNPIIPCALIIRFVYIIFIVLTHANMVTNRKQIKLCGQRVNEPFTKPIYRLGMQVSGNVPRCLYTRTSRM